MARPKGDGSGKPTKTDMVNAALAELGADAKPLAIQEFVKSKFNKELSTTLISNYKSVGKRKGGKAGGKRRGRPPRAASGALHIEDLEAVRSLVKKLGPDNVVRLVGVVT
jgi:hypothetical protein